MKDYVSAMQARLTALDPSYGSQAHQRDFIARCKRMQSIAPCHKNHDADNPPEHRYAALLDRDGKVIEPACYTHDVMQRAGA